MFEIEKNKQQCRKTSGIRLSKHVKIKALSPCPFPGKIQLLFAIFGLFLPGNSVESQGKWLESKFDKSCFIHTIPGQLPIKVLVSTFSSFATIGHKAHFRKIVTQTFKFGSFCWYHNYIFKKNELNFLMENLKLNRLARISSPKKEKAKSSYTLLYLPFFILRPI